MIKQFWSNPEAIQSIWEIIAVSLAITELVSADVFLLQCICWKENARYSHHTLKAYIDRFPWVLCMLCNSLRHMQVQQHFQSVLSALSSFMAWISDNTGSSTGSSWHAPCNRIPFYVIRKLTGVVGVWWMLTVFPMPGSNYKTGFLFQHTNLEIQGFIGAF